MVTLAGLLGRRGTCDEVCVPLVGVEVTAEVHDFVAEVKVRQYYRNTESSDIEAVYHFPLDEASCVCGFQAEYEDGTLVNGVVKDKDEAQLEYDTAIRRGQQAQLLEEVRPDIFTVSVGRLPPGAHIAIRLTYITTLKAEGSASRFILPTHVAQRYTPAQSHAFGSAGSVPSVPESMKQFYHLTLKITYHCRSRIVRISSETHPGDVVVLMKDRKGEVSVSEIALNKELVVLCEEEKAHQPRACVEIASDGSMAGLVTIFPKIEFRDVAREIIFVIDRSGSMSAGSYFGITRQPARSFWKSQIQQAKEALLLFLRALPQGCTFNIVGFGSTFKPLFPQSRKYDDESLAEATRYAEAMQADLGGTAILQPLEFCFGSSGGAERCSLLRASQLRCPGAHELGVMQAPAEDWTCEVCARKVDKGEVLTGCRVCNWDACDVCAFGCPGRHELTKLAAHTSTMFCDVCKRALAFGEMAMACRGCDWDACSACYEGFRAKRSAIYGDESKQCPGRHDLAAISTTAESRCQVCLSSQPPGSDMVECGACAWTACGVCSFGCRRRHQLTPFTIQNDTSFCDPCRKAFKQGDASMCCRACDWDACLQCYQAWVDKKKAQRRQRQVFVLTDGQVGNESQVFECVRKACSRQADSDPPPARVFALGIGDGVSHHLVEGIARHGKGTAAFVSEGASLRGKVLGQLKQALQPSFDDVSVTWNFTPSGGAEPPHRPQPPAPAAFPAQQNNTLLGHQRLGQPPAPADRAAALRQVPAVAPPVFNQERFLSMALFPRGQVVLPQSVTVAAVTPDGPLSVTIDLDPTEVLRGDIAHRLAARARIRELEDEFFSGRPRMLFGPSPTQPANTQVDVHKAEALALALHHGLVSRFTSIVAVRQGRDGATHTLVVQSRTVAQQSNTFGGFGSANAVGVFGSAAPRAPAGGGFGSAGASGGAAGFGGGQTTAFGSSARAAEGGREEAAEADGVLAVCLLQRADGSFLCDLQLAQALRCALGDLEEALQSALPATPPGEGKSTYGTVAAVVAFRVLFEDEREAWELLELKAMEVLKARGVSDKGLEAATEKLRYVIRKESDNAKRSKA